MNEMYERNLPEYLANDLAAMDEALSGDAKLSVRDVVGIIPKGVDLVAEYRRHLEEKYLRGREA